MIEKQHFGKTGHMSTRIIFGAAALAHVNQEQADRTLDLLLQYGINHIDTAASYGDSELRVGAWMKQHRQDFFLATKTDKRTFQGALEELHRSLDRLQVEQIDLWQMHLLVDPGEWQVAMGPGGALEAFIQAREQGLVRFLGVTGHGVSIAAMHLKSLAQFEFDSVLLPLNYTMMQLPAYADAFTELLDRCREKNTAVQTIKSLVRRPWGDRPHTHATWYQPIEGPEDIDLAVHWVLGHPSVFLNSTADVDLLPLVLKAGERFKGQPPKEEMEAMVKRLGMESLF